ncbi:MAG: magnesium/cobalt efflux protein [Gammaproteobacteria bacterium]|nr:MAG: magnesium/cobalt efflux protein [Gammaproteobacteria bacterium]
MNEDNGKPPSPSWLERLTQLVHTDPKDREELLTVFRVATENTIINEDSFSMLEGVLKMSDMQARDIMVPRSLMVVIEKGTDLQGILEKVIASAHSRFPVIGDDRDDVLGILLAKDLLNYFNPNNLEKDSSQHLMDNLRQAIVVPESKRLDVLLKEFRVNRHHMAIVVDEYGGVSGLVTIEDILEEIVGEIEDETDVESEVAMIEELSDNKWLVQAQIDIEEFNDYFKVNFEDDEYDTVSGLLLQSFGHLPTKDETVVIENFNIKIVEADNRRILSIHLSLLEKPDDPEE